MDEQKKQKNNKVVNIVVNVVVAVILVVALIVTINNISSKRKGYTAMLGTAYMVVQSGSMDPDNLKRPEDYEAFLAEGKLPGFKKDDLVRVKVLNDKQKKELEVGDIISFHQDVIIDGETERIVNSHRIVEKNVNQETGEVTYWTCGDANPDGQKEVISTSTVEGANLYLIGVVKGKSGAMGHVITFFNSQTGFLVFIVIPSFLVVIYFAFNLTREVLKYKKAGAAESKAKYEEELIAKLRAQGVQIPADMDTSAPSKEETADTANDVAPAEESQQEPSEGKKK